jgi:hypothetical protein
MLCNLSDLPFRALNEKKYIENIKNMPHRSLDLKISQDIRNIYEICMIKNYLA